jgi:hypothetical protein
MTYYDKNKITASMLFAGSRHNPGNQHCYYRGADCDKTYSVYKLSLPNIWEKEEEVLGAKIISVAGTLCLGMKAATTATD